MNIDDQNVICDGTTSPMPAVLTVVAAGADRLHRRETRSSGRALLNNSGPQ